MDFLQFYQLGSSSTSTGGGLKNPGNDVNNSYSTDQSWIMGKILLGIVILDFFYILSVDNLLHQPLVILVIFVCQVLGFVVSLILYIMGAANQAMESGLSPLNIRHHEASLLTLIVYIILTFIWNVWTLRRSWPSISEQFSFSFLSTYNESHFQNNLDLENSETANSFYNGPIMSSSSESGSRREFSTLWSPGYMALYVCLRTVGVLWYVTFLKSAFIMFNSNLIDQLLNNNDAVQPGSNNNNNNLQIIKTIDSRLMKNHQKSQSQDQNLAEVSSSNSQSSDEEVSQEDLPNQSQIFAMPINSNNAYGNQNQIIKSVSREHRRVNDSNEELRSKSRNVTYDIEEVEGDGDHSGLNTNQIDEIFEYNGSQNSAYTPPVKLKGQQVKGIPKPRAAVATISSPEGSQSHTFLTRKRAEIPQNNHKKQNMEMTSKASHQVTEVDSEDSQNDIEIFNKPKPNTTATADYQERY